MLNQIELHPLLTQRELRDFCKKEKIQIEAWRPLMNGNLENPVLARLAEKYKKTPAQIVLRWNLQNEIIIIPKSVNKQRIYENADIFDFKLEKDDMEQIDSLNENKRLGPDPDNFDF